MPLIKKVERFKADLNVNGANVRDVILATAAELGVPTEGQALGPLATACWKLLYGDGDEADETSLSIRELKQELGRRGIDCGSCVEKRELVQLLRDASAPASKRAGASSGAGSSSSGEQPDITKVRVRVRTRAKVRARVRVRAGVRATARARVRVRAKG